MHIYTCKMIEFKKLELKNDRHWFHRIFGSAHAKRTIVFIFIGALAGFIISIVSASGKIDNIAISEIIKSTLLGGFFGFFITNSPCARGRC
jgi:hypothetical protein